MARISLGGGATRAAGTRATVNRRVAIRILLSLLVLPFIFTAASAAGLDGKHRKGVYSSPARNFTVPVPSGIGMKVSDAYEKDVAGQFGAVSFHDDFGKLLAIHYMSVPAEAVAALAQPEYLDHILQSWLETVAMPTWFLNAAPGSRLTHRDYGSFEDLRALFATVELPGASHLVTMDRTGKQKRLDSTRGLVIFQRGPYIYMLATELRGLGELLKSGEETEPPLAADAEGKWLYFVDRLKPFYRSIGFVE